MKIINRHPAYSNHNEQITQRNQAYTLAFCAINHITPDSCPLDPIEAIRQSDPNQPRPEQKGGHLS